MLSRSLISVFHLPAHAVQFNNSMPYGAAIARFSFFHFVPKTKDLLPE
jgi:hypothetical protein